MKIIFFDIDGTLIWDKSQLMSESTKEAIRIARANGNICMINTGRTKILVGEEITGQVEFDGFLLGCGTMVLYHDQVLMHQTFPDELSAKIMDGLKKHGIDVVLEGSDGLYCESPERMETKAFGQFVQGLDASRRLPYGQAVGKFDKFYCYVEDQSRMDAFQAEFNEVLDFIDRDGGFYEVLPKGASKATGIDFIAKHLGLSLEDTVAIGDSSNDFPMLEHAKISIAMGNAIQAVKDMATYVTTDVKEDGIWNALKWLGVLD